MNDRPMSARRMDTAVASPLAIVTRGGITESMHRGHLAVVDGRGQLLAHLGDPEALTFLRSSAKPFQALPVLTTGAAERFGLTDGEVALICGSHGGEPIHTAAVRGLFERAGLTPDTLCCGIHAPYDPSARQHLEEQGEPPSVLHNNCSGKHAGMLLLAHHLGAPLETYWQANHPVQRHILDALIQLAERPREAVHLGADGCGVPTFAVPIQTMARLFAALAHPPEGLDASTRTACTRIVRAMMAYPEMVEGTDLAQCLDTALMQALPGRIASKVGAEGVYTAAILPCPEWPHGLGVAFKLEDGDVSKRVRGPVALALLRRLGLLGETVPEPLAAHAATAIHNHRGDRVGEIQPHPALRTLERPARA